MIFKFILAIFYLTGLAIAGCVEDSDWNFGLVGASTYYAAVPTNGDIYVFAANQCLDMTSRQCVPCYGLRYGSFFYEFSKVGKCIITSIPTGSRKRTDDMVETLIDSRSDLSNKNGKSSSPSPVVTGALPAGDIIWSLRCGIDLGS